MKPFVTYENRFYQAGTKYNDLTEKQKKLINEPYLSAIIEDLSNITIKLSQSTQNLLIEAIESLSKLDGYIKDHVSSFHMLLYRLEALSSSKLESYITSHKAVACAQINQKQTEETMIVKANLEALIQGISFENALDINQMIHLNQIVLEDHKIDIRHRINWIGIPNSIPQEAIFVPPHYDHLDNYMNHFISFCKRNDMHPLILSSFAHAYFEIIHPFEDGNGRVGRLLIHMLLKEKLFLKHMVMPFSVGMVKDQKKYHKALREFTYGNYESMIQMMLENAILLAPKVYHLLDDVIKLKRLWAQKLKLRHNTLAFKMLDDLLIQPVFDVGYIKEKHQVSNQTVRNNIKTLMSFNIVSSIRNSKHPVIYEAKEVLDLLDQFTL